MKILRKIFTLIDFEDSIDFEWFNSKRSGRFLVNGFEGKGRLQIEKGYIF